MSKKKKILILVLLIVLLAVAGWILWRNHEQSSGNKDADNTEQKEKISACNSFSSDDAKKIFGDDIFQNSLDATSGAELL